MKKILLKLTCAIILSGCHFTNSDKLTNNDINYIKKLNLLDADERIVWFDSQLTVKSSGNFLTNKRIASYWIDKYNKERSYLTFALLKDIDSVKLKDLSNSITYSSHIEVFKGNESFRVYIGQDTLKVKEYYRETLKLIDGYANVSN
ncbi:hypothetical protein ACJD0Z_04200 [Flavobacteriaceae bacterium M23B6Z8]